MTIHVENLSFHYEKRFPVLRDISFNVNKGQFIGIFGPNGGGKTTLLRLLLGLAHPSNGIIQILEISPEKASDRIGYVPQVRHLDKQFPISVMEVVLHGCLSSHHIGNFSSVSKKKALEALERVNLADKKNQAFGTLSGGQIQRTLIARALVSDPEILLLDEAMAGIDPEASHEIFQLLVELRGKITILLVTHELLSIAKEMDHLLCINRDLTVYTPDQVCSHFAMGLYHPPLIKKEKKND